MMIQIHKRGILYCLSEIDSIEASSLPSCFMHKFQIPNATIIANKRRPRVLQRFFVVFLTAVLALQRKPHDA